MTNQFPLSLVLSITNVNFLDSERSEDEHIIS